MRFGKGNLRGAEFDIPQYWTNGLTTEAGNVTANVVLWPKVIVLALSQQRWDTLSDEQQGWVRAAADQAVQTSVEATYDETSPAQKLCAEGVRFIEASAEQIVALRESLAPVLTQLAGDPLMADIQALAAQHPDADVPDVPVRLPTGRGERRSQCDEQYSGNDLLPARGHLPGRYQPGRPRGRPDLATVLVGPAPGR